VTLGVRKWQNYDNDIVDADVTSAEISCTFKEAKASFFLPSFAVEAAAETCKMASRLAWIFQIFVVVHNSETDFGRSGLVLVNDLASGSFSSGKV
jgi:hypothetical protein